MLQQPQCWETNVAQAFGIMHSGLRGKGYETRFDDVVEWNACPQPKFEGNGRLRISLIGPEHCKAERRDQVRP